MNNFFQDDKGNNSSMRIMVAFIVFSVFGTWAFVSIKTSTMAQMNFETALAAVGSLFAKAWQKEKEQ